MWSLLMMYKIPHNWLMNKGTLLTIAMFMGIILIAQKRGLSTIYDGPYIFIEENGIRYKNIVAGKLLDTLVHRNDLMLPTLYPINEKKSRKWKYKEVSKFVALSDIHGQYDVMLRLFKAHGVVGKNDHWSYGDGHLVIVGDIFDRGDQVTQILWFLYHLEQEAQAAGGMVHVLLGNHELLVLNGDTRYVHKDYRYTKALTQTQYPQLFGPNAILGQWLRSKNVVLVLGKHVFVHGGISPELAEAKISPKTINERFKKEIIDKTDNEIYSDELNGYLNSDYGPVWYRNYSDEVLFTEEHLMPVLKYLKAKHIIVGHTSYDSIWSRFDQKLFFVDSSIKNGEDGEVLIYEDKVHYRGDMDGNRTKF